MKTAVKTIFANVSSNMGEHVVRAESRTGLRLAIEETIDSLRRRRDRDIRVRYLRMGDVIEADTRFGKAFVTRPFSKQKIKMKTVVLDNSNYAAIMEICRRDKERQARRYVRQVRLQNWAARFGYKFWNKIFNIF